MARTGRPRTPPIERFSARLREDENGCVEWTGTIDKYGYGQFNPGGRYGVMVGAHRWSYEHFVGSIPEGMHIDHLCRNTKCVNPNHLEPVTPRENVMRGFGPAAINARKTHCIKGHPFAGDNLLVSQGKRCCRQCKRNRQTPKEKAK